MKYLIGLGNPGRKYATTRHNIGFMVIDELLYRHQWALNITKFNGEYALEHFEGEKVMLLKPQTFMNLAGESIRPLLDYYNIDIDDILRIYDHLDLATGSLRLRK